MFVIFWSLKVCSKSNNHSRFFIIFLFFLLSLLSSWLHIYFNKIWRWYKSYDSWICTKYWTAQRLILMNKTVSLPSSALPWRFLSQISFCFPSFPHHLFISLDLFFQIFLFFYFVHLTCYFFFFYRAFSFPFFYYILFYLFLCIFFLLQQNGFFFLSIHQSLLAFSIFLFIFFLWYFTAFHSFFSFIIPWFLWWNKTGILHKCNYFRTAVWLHYFISLKRLKIIDGNNTNLCLPFLNIWRKQHPVKQYLRGHLTPISQTMLDGKTRDFSHRYGK